MLHAAALAPRALAGASTGGARGAANTVAMVDEKAQALPAKNVTDVAEAILRCAVRCEAMVSKATQGATSVLLAQHQV